VEIGDKGFQVRRLVDEDGEDLGNHLDEKRFKEGRAGDHLMTPFQCETCHFRNIYHRNPSARSSTDQEAQVFFRRASLDAFWSRAPSTVKGNLNEGKRNQRFEERMGVPCLVPKMGPFPLSDSMGMMSAAAILDRSLDPGRSERYVQWDTFRGTRSFLTNATQAGVSGLGETVGAYEKNKMWISNVVTHSFWFSRFMEGLHKRVGEVRHQDEPITIEVLKEIEVILESEWSNATTPSGRLRAAEMGVWFIAGFCSGLRGEEMLLIELAGTATNLDFLGDRALPHFVLIISGPTKGNQLSGSKFGVPIVATTEGTYLRPGKWVQRLVTLRTEKGDTTGRLFRRRLVPSKLYEFENDFFSVLRKVQNSTTFISRDTDVASSYGILRSLRRGMTAHARNMNVSKDELQTFNRWNKEMNAKTGLARLDMPDTYSALGSLKPTLLRVTRAL
jgi:hypothetical protein